MNNLNIVYLFHKGCNLGYLHNVLNIINENNISVKFISLKDFIKDEFTCNITDIILYQVWPDDRIYENGDIKKPINNNNKYIELNGQNHPKFPKELIENCDIKFLRLPNKKKILVDLHDDGDIDAFSRFNDNKYLFLNNELKELINSIIINNNYYFYKIPRIKNTPSVEYKNKFNVILDTTYLVKKNILNKDLLYNNRNILFHYFSSDASNPIRSVVKNKLVEVNKTEKIINMKKITNYPNDLQKILCEINVPGWGKVCFRHLDTLNNACLLFAFEDIKDLYILPNIKLIEDEDYISYNIDNLETKIDYIINNKEKIEKIRINGYNKFNKAYNYNNSANKLINELNKI